MKRWMRTIGWMALGLTAGVLLGLYLGWIAWPTEFSDANPALLAEPYKQDYLRMVATVYAADADLPAAQSRLAALGDDGQEFLNDFVLDQILQGQRDENMRQLARLAHDLGLDSPALQPFLTPAAESAAP